MVPENCIWSEGKNKKLERVGRICAKMKWLAMDRCKDTNGSITKHNKTDHLFVSLTYLHKPFYRGYGSRGSFLA